MIPRIMTPEMATLFAPSGRDAGDVPEMLPIGGMFCVGTLFATQFCQYGPVMKTGFAGHRFEDSGRFQTTGGW